jgi:DNA-3-methyladenine glycosylase II
MTADDYARARRALMRRDPVLGAAIRRIGACGLEARQQRDAFTALVRAIVGQQLSAKAAATIFERLRALFPGGELTGAGAFATLDDAALRRVGLSSQKLSYVRDLCARMSDGRLSLDELVELPDDEVIARLTEVRGFGRWTAEMFLIFRLNRPDILPVGDLGIVRAVQQLYRLRVPPDAKRLTSIGERWRPYRSVACWYLWQSLAASPTSTRTATVPVRRTKRPQPRSLSRSTE